MIYEWELGVDKYAHLLRVKVDKTIEKEVMSEIKRTKSIKSTRPLRRSTIIRYQLRKVIRRRLAGIARNKYIWRRLVGIILRTLRIKARSFKDTF